MKIDPRARKKLGQRFAAFLTFTALLLIGGACNESDSTEPPILEEKIEIGFSSEQVGIILGATQGQAVPFFAPQSLPLLSLPPPDTRVYFSRTEEKIYLVRYSGLNPPGFFTEEVLTMSAAELAEGAKKNIRPRGNGGITGQTAYELEGSRYDYYWWVWDDYDSQVWIDEDGSPRGWIIVTGDELRDYLRQKISGEP